MQKIFKTSAFLVHTEYILVSFGSDYSSILMNVLHYSQNFFRIITSILTPYDVIIYISEHEVYAPYEHLKLYEFSLNVFTEFSGKNVYD